MTEKIEWYREVLELEPNSKVFLPLAKLLVEENGDSQAIDILQRGLDRHPDFLEARLFLIELLYKMGKNDECDAEVKKLGKMFATYAGFWQAWAACLSGDNEQDTASMLRFLAATFLHGPLSLHDVLNRGLATYIPDARMGAPKAEAQSQTPAKAAEEENEAIAEQAPGQMDIEHANNQALDEIVQPAAEEAPVEAVEESPETAAPPIVAEEELPAAEMAVEQEAEEATAAESPTAEAQPVEVQPAEDQPVEAAQDEQVAAEEQAEIEEPEAQAWQEASTQEAQAGQEEQAAQEEAAIEPQIEEQPAQEAQAPAEEQAGSEEPASGEAVIAEAASEEPAVEESGESMAAEAMPEADEPQEEDMVSNAAEVEAGSSEAPAITEVREPVAQENIEAAPAPEQAPVVAEENQAAETEMPAEAQPEMPEEALAASQEEALPAPGAEELPATEQISSESLARPSLEEIRETANGDAETEDVVGTGGESLQTIFEQNIASGNPETATENLPGEARDLPVVESAPRAEPANELAAEEYTPKFKDSGEQYTVRTRSMAEVLAEQDDLGGALEIYRELLAAAPEGAEKNDLQLRISTLAQKLHEAEEAASAPVEYEPGSVSSRSREKLISMLEALARRVEARAQS